MVVSRRDKLIQRFLQRPTSVTFEDARTLLKLHGWTLDRTRGSHHIFVKPGERSYPVPVHNGVVKQRYVAAICDLLNLDLEEHD